MKKEKNVKTEKKDWKENIQKFSRNRIFECGNEWKKKRKIWFWIWYWKGLYISATDDSNNYEWKHADSKKNTSRRENSPSAKKSKKYVKKAINVYNI